MGSSVRSICLLLAAGALAFAAYGSLLPFNFEYVPLGDAVRTFVAILGAAPARRPSRTDMLANLLLFVPVGFFLAGSFMAGAPRTLARMCAAAAVVLPLSVAASVLIELSQVFTPDRVPSRVDVATQTIGCFVGLVLWVIGGDSIVRWIRESARAAPGDRVGRVLLAYAVGWTLVNLAPFDLTVDVGDLGRRVRTGKIVPVPFTEADRLTVGWWWDALAEILAALPLGLLAGLAPKGRMAGSIVLPAAAMLGLVFSIELAQVFIRSHAARGTDWLLASCGVVIGLALARRHTGGHLGLDSIGVHRRAFALVVVWVGVLCAYHWNPFEFAVDREVISGKLSRISLIPFAGYRTGSYLNTLNNLLTKISLSLPLGVFAGFALRGFPAGRSTQVVVSVAVFAGIFGVVELGQLFLVSRMPDPTDVMVGICAATAGLCLAFWLHSSNGGDGR